MKTLKNNIKKFVSRLAKDRSGEAFVDVALKILIVVVIGAAILAIMNVAMRTMGLSTTGRTFSLCTPLRRIWIL